MTLPSKKIKEIIDKALLDIFEENVQEDNQLGLIDYDLTNHEDISYLSQVGSIIWEIIQSAYANIGGFKSFKSLQEMLKRANQITLGFYNGEIVAVSVYNDYLGGNKEVGIAAIKGTNHSYGVSLVEKIIQRNIALWDNWYWIEASSKIEELYLKNDGFPIPNIYVPGIFPNKNIEISDDGFHYHRSIGGEAIEDEKMMFGFKDKELKEKIEKDFPLGFSEKINVIKQRILGESKYSTKLTQLEASKHIVDMFIDAYQNGLTQVSVNLLQELKSNLTIIQQYINNGQCPPNRLRAMKFAYEDGVETLKNLKQLNIFTIRDLY